MQLGEWSERQRPGLLYLVRGTDCWRWRKTSCEHGQVDHPRWLTSAWSRRRPILGAKSGQLAAAAHARAVTRDKRRRGFLSAVEPVEISLATSEDQSGFTRSIIPKSAAGGGRPDTRGTRVRGQGTSRCQSGERAISRAASSPPTSTRVAGIGKVRLTCPTEVRAVLRQRNRAALPLRKSRAGSAEIRCRPERGAVSRRTETSSGPAAALRGPVGPDPGCRGAACRDSQAPARAAD